MSLQTTVRPATDDDVAAIRRVAGETWHTVYDDILGEDTVDELLIKGYNPDILERIVDLDEIGLFVVIEDGDVVGYASCGMTDTVGHGDLDIYVHPEYWGRGLGSKLLERGRIFLRSLTVRTVCEEVLANNAVGNAFYRKHFDYVGGRPAEFAGKQRRVNIYELSLWE